MRAEKALKKLKDYQKEKLMLLQEKTGIHRESEAQNIVKNPVEYIEVPSTEDVVGEEMSVMGEMAKVSPLKEVEELTSTSIQARLKTIENSEMDEETIESELFLNEKEIEGLLKQLREK